MPPKPWPIIINELYGDVPTGFFPVEDTSRKMVLLYTGGLRKVAQLPSCTEVRECWSWGDYRYWVSRRGGQAVVHKMDDSHGVVEIGTITTSTSGPAWMRNNQSQLAVCDGVGLYVYTPGSNNFVQVLNYTPASDGVLPALATLDYQDGMGLLVEANSNRWLFTAINDFTNINASNFYSKEATTDNIQAVFQYQRYPYVFGTDFSTEPWYNAGGDNQSLQTPLFARNPGGLVMYGLAAPKAVTDMCGTRLTFLTTGGQIVYAVGYQGEVASSDMFHRQVAGDGGLVYPGYSTLSDARAFSFVDRNHYFHQLTFPAADVTWLLDGTTGLLIKRQSYKTAGGWGRHRANCCCLHKNKYYVGDYETGAVYEMSPQYLDDDGHAIQRLLYSQEMLGGRQLVSAPNVQVMMEMGAGLPAGVVPYVGLEFSADGGLTWSNMVDKSAGATGQGTYQANWNQLGSFYRRMYRATFTAAVPWKIFGIDGWGEAAGVR